jgi:hypothetical protein
MKPLFPTFYLLKLLSITIFAVDYLYRVGMGGFIRENIYIKNIRKIGMKSSSNRENIENKNFINMLYRVGDLLAKTYINVLYRMGKFIKKNIYKCVIESGVERFIRENIYIIYVFSHKSLTPAYYIYVFSNKFSISTLIKL